jgi:hypothetical protein
VHTGQGRLRCRAEHHAVDDDGLFVAEEVGEVDYSFFAVEGEVLGYGASLGQGATHCGDMLDVDVLVQSLRRGECCAHGGIRGSRWGSVICSLLPVG